MDKSQLLQLLQQAEVPLNKIPKDVAKKIAEAVTEETKENGIDVARFTSAI